jgi:hypothetical protein
MDEIEIVETIESAWPRLATNMITHTGNQMWTCVEHGHFKIYAAMEHRPEDTECPVVARLVVVDSSRPVIADRLRVMRESISADLIISADMANRAIDKKSMSIKMAMALQLQYLIGFICFPDQHFEDEFKAVLFQEKTEEFGLPAEIIRLAKQ